MANAVRCEDFIAGYPYAVHGATAKEVMREAAAPLAEVHHIKKGTPGIAVTAKRNIRTVA